MKVADSSIVDEIKHRGIFTAAFAQKEACKEEQLIYEKPIKEFHNLAWFVPAFIAFSWQRLFHGWSQQQTAGANSAYLQFQSGLPNLATIIEPSLF